MYIFYNISRFKVGTLLLHVQVYTRSLFVNHTPEVSYIIRDKGLFSLINEYSSKNFHS